MHNITMAVAQHEHFVYYQSVNADPNGEVAISRIAAAIGEPARARMLCCLMDGRARTSTELAMVASVGPPTTSVHLRRLVTERLVKVLPQGKHRYYSLGGANVAAMLEALSVLAGGWPDKFVPSTPNRLRTARTCYDHIAGTLGVMLNDRFSALGWLSAGPSGVDTAYDLSLAGVKAFENFGIDISATRIVRRRFAYGCRDWSERRPHLGGALGAALLKLALTRRWVLQDLDSRALSITRFGRREMLSRLGLRI